MHEQGVNICPQKSETVYPPIWGILKLSVLLNHYILKLSIKILKQSQNRQPKHKSTFFKSKNIINLHYVFNIKETQVCVWVDLLPRHHNFWNVKGLQHIYFHICLVQNCLSQANISETVYGLSWFWNCLSWKGQANGFLFTPVENIGLSFLTSYHIIS